MSSSTTTSNHPGSFTHSTLQDFLEYPYDPKNPPSVLNDFYDRSPTWLLASMAYFGRWFIKGKYNEPLDVPRQYIYTLCNIAEDEFLPIDAKYLYSLETESNREIYRHSLLLGLNWLDLSEKELLTSLPNLNDIRQVVIPYFQSRTQQWAVFRLSKIGRDIEGYIFGRYDHQTFQPDVERLLSVFRKKLRKPDITFYCRLEIPVTLSRNIGFASYVFALVIHRQLNYFTLSWDMMIYYTFCYYKNFRRLHDKILGRVLLEDVTAISHPFICSKKEAKISHLVPVKRHGWAPVDVERDGNCGFYATLIAFENTNIRTYSPPNLNSNQTTMRTSVPWQRSSESLRECLQEHATLLITRYYNDPDNRPSWFRDNIDVRDDIDYHMNPYWAGIVIASRFHMRVVIVARLEVAQNQISWTTTSYTHNAEVGEPDHITSEHWEGIKRISDDEYRQKPTIELLYVTGSRNSEDSHFLFLRRVLFFGTKPPPHRNRNNLH
jgi:hypothetical protein